MGMVSEVNGKLNEAYEFYNAALAIQYSKQITVALGYTYANIGGVLTALKRYDEAERALYSSLNIRNLLGETQNVAICFTNLAELMLAQKKTKDAITFFEKSLFMAVQLKYPDLIKYNYQKLSECYASVSNYKAAYENFIAYSTYKDSLFNETKAKQIAELQTKYDSEKKEQQNLFLTSANKLTALQLRKSKIQNVALLAMLILLLVVGYLWYQSNKLKQEHKANKQLLAFERQRLQVVIQTQEDERKRISQDLHDGIGQLLSAAKLNVAALESSIQNTSLQRAMHIIDEACTEVRSISHQMMPALLYKTGLANTLIQQCSDFETEKMKVVVDADDELIGYKHIHDNSIYRIIQELMQNTIKHSNASHIHISLNINTVNSLVVMIEDDGNYFDFEQIKTGSGNGWFNIQSRLAIAGATIMAENNSMNRNGNILFIELANYYNTQLAQ
jgi:two-component system NarL family sensor kinase